ncbi:MAG: GDSL-type esterase/lipase family protein [Bryobacteraceae bacterium]|jgi:lysophospholipase L1-like esterase
MRKFPISTALTIVSLGALLMLLRVWLPAAIDTPKALVGAMVDFSPQSTPASPLVERHEPEAPTVPPERPAAAAGSPMHPPLLDDRNGALDRFYESLWRTEKGAGMTRILHYGDSPTTADLITGDVRHLLEERYGDGGHGLVLISKPWAWYQHRGVELSGSGWQMAPASSFKALDGAFGLGGVSFIGLVGAHSKLVLNDPGQSNFELWYMAEPDGGVVTLEAEGHQVARIATDGVAGPAFAAFTVPGGAHELDLAVESGRVRLFGITAEKPGPGVVYDSAGLNGASITVLSRMFNEAYWAEELRHRNPVLVVINYGTNEADFASFVDKGYEKELREAIRRLRAALPQASILIMSPMDRGAREGADGIVTMPTIPRIVALERRVAGETGCGFFDTFDAMGGEGPMARWYTGEPRLVSADLIHPYPAGGKLIAAVMVKEIDRGLNRYKLRSVMAEPRP